MTREAPRVAIVTGASQGIGQALVTALRQAGYGVVGTSRSIAPSDDRDFVTVRGDISDAETADQVVREALERLPGFKVGICWQGSQKYGGDANRSIPLKHFGVLSQVPGVQLISLQKGFGTEQSPGSSSTGGSMTAARSGGLCVIPRPNRSIGS